MAPSCSRADASRKWRRARTGSGVGFLSGSPVPAARALAARGRRQARAARARRGIQARYKARSRPTALAAAAAGMASARSPAGALLLLTCASLIAAMGLGVPEPAAPVGNHAHPRLPGTELPAPPEDSPPVRRGCTPDFPVPGGQRR